MNESKIIYAPPKLDPSTNRRSAGTILAVRRDTYKDATAIPTPSHLRDYVSSAAFTPHDGSPIVTISAYMPQLNTKAQETLYLEILRWIEQDFIFESPSAITFMCEDLQANP